MKKYIALYLALSLFAFAGCMSNNDTTTDENKPDTTTEDTSKIPEDNMDDMQTGDDTQVATMYMDGVYKAEAKDYENLYKHYVEITIKENKIEKVLFDGLDETGKFKSDDEELRTKYEEDYQTTPEDLMGMYSDKLIESQTVDMVLEITGGERENQMFKMLANAALMNAQTGEKTTAIVDLNMD